MQISHLIHNPDTDASSQVVQKAVVDHLEVLNKNVELQMSLWYAFRNGVMYGIGFVIGSTVLTAFVVSFVLTFMSNTVFAEAIMWLANRGQ
jgi:hypothetical protein